MTNTAQTQPKIYHIDAGYKMMDTCAGSFAAKSAGEFNAETPYFYSTDSENEAEEKGSIYV